MSSQPIEIKGSKKSIFIGIDLNYEGIETLHFVQGQLKPM
jgi:hypothetical protein